MFLDERGHIDPFDIIPKLGLLRGGRGFASRLLVLEVLL
jgi:hypothetical protein